MDKKGHPYLLLCYCMHQSPLKSQQIYYYSLASQTTYFSVAPLSEGQALVKEKTNKTPPQNTDEKRGLGECFFFATYVSWNISNWNPSTWRTEQQS